MKQKVSIDLDPDSEISFWLTSQNDGVVIEVNKKSFGTMKTTIPIHEWEDVVEELQRQHKEASK